MASLPSQPVHQQKFEKNLTFWEGIYSKFKIPCTNVRKNRSLRPNNNLLFQCSLL